MARVATRQLYIGTSGWHYADWMGSFYPPEITGYQELAYHARHFNTVENNSSFYRIAGEGTYRTWNRMTPEGYVFSMKLNKAVTHTARLEITDAVRQVVDYIGETTQVLGGKKGVMLIQLPASFRPDLPRVAAFLDYIQTALASQPDPFALAIEFRHKAWFTDETYAMLRRHNVALVAGDSSRWPGVRVVTADMAYIRMHGPEKLFASLYSTQQLAELAAYIRALPPTVYKVYVYFNNDFHGYALHNARELMGMLGIAPAASQT